MAQDKKKNNKPKDLAYYLTMFKIEGHETWRVQLHPTPEGFAAEIAKAINMPKVTEKKVHRIDRITGEITLQ